MIFEVVIIDGEWTEYLEDPTVPGLLFENLPRDEAITLVRQAFDNGYQCVVIKNGGDEQ